ncbi:MAG: hypothetical protein QW390_04930 [Candidatus Bathyarchaeia archaeon]
MRIMGAVYRPEDLRRKRRIPDVKPGAFPEPAPHGLIEDLADEVKELRFEVERIKKALRERGMPI